MLMCAPQVVNAYVSKDQDDNIIMVAADHIKPGEEVTCDKTRTGDSGLALLLMSRLRGST
jgi:hypothetical protein